MPSRIQGARARAGVDEQEATRLLPVQRGRDRQDLPGRRSNATTTPPGRSQPSYPGRTSAPAQSREVSRRGPKRRCCTPHCRGPQALRPRDADVVIGQHLEQARAKQARQARGGVGSSRRSRAGLWWKLDEATDASSGPGNVRACPGVSARCLRSPRPSGVARFILATQVRLVHLVRRCRLRSGARPR
jgi:hypothetical protein